LGGSDPFYTGSLQPNSVPFRAILPILSCETLLLLGHLLARQGEREGDGRVNRPFHAPFTLPALQIAIEAHRKYSGPHHKKPPNWKSSIKIFPFDRRETVPSIFMVESPPSSLYLLGNFQLEKVRNYFISVGEVRRWERIPTAAPYLFRSIGREKRRKNLGTSSFSRTRLEHEATEEVRGMGASSPYRPINRRGLSQ